MGTGMGTKIQPGSGTTFGRLRGTVGKFAIVTNISNGAGLQKDYELLRRMLESYGHDVWGEMFNSHTPTLRHVDVVIFLEVIDPRWIPFAKQVWFVPNSEWYFDCWDCQLRHITKVLCKTKDCLRLWTKKVGPAKCFYTGFEAEDFLDRSIKREPKFLHMFRNSENKGTPAVAAAWRNHRLPYPLTLVGRRAETLRLCHGIPNATVLEDLTKVEVMRLMNEHQFILAPTRNEGYGMFIHEALGCGGIVITTDAPPMNEFQGVAKPLLIPFWNQVPRLMTHFYEVNPEQVARRVHEAAQLYPDQIAKFSQEARTGFENERSQFRNAFEEIVRASF